MEPSAAAVGLTRTDLASAVFNAAQLAQVRERHTESGRHTTETVAFPKWVPSNVLLQARKLTLEQAVEALKASGVGAKRRHVETI